MCLKGCGEAAFIELAHILSCMLTAQARGSSSEGDSFNLGETV